MTLIERINSFINAVAADIKSLYANKVNKTDVINVAQGGTGSSVPEWGRYNLGIKSSATYDVGKVKNTIPLFQDVLYANNNVAAPLAPSNYDFNKSSPGDWYFVNDTSLPNSPPFVSTVESFTTFSDLTNMYSIAYGFYNATIAIRNKRGGTWGNWSELLSNGSRANLLSVKTGSSSYNKSWRKIMAPLPDSEGETKVAHGSYNASYVMVKVTNSDGIRVFQNDPDIENHFYVRMSDQNIIIGVKNTSTKVLGRYASIYLEEEL